MNVFWSVTKYFLLGSNVASHTKRSRTKKHCLCRGAVASWLARSPPHRVARVRALTGEKPCCVNLSLTVPLSYEFSKVWLPCSIPSRESRITPNRFVLLTPEISGGLMATWLVYADFNPECTLFSQDHWLIKRSTGFNYLDQPSNPKN